MYDALFSNNGLQVNDLMQTFEDRTTSLHLLKNRTDVRGTYTDSYKNYIHETQNEDKL